jgi:CheY-like chemotaxis protein
MSGCRVLLVEDDPHLRTAMSRLLMQAGHEVVQAFTAEAAMGLLAKEKPFNVVLLDIMLDGQSGWVVAGYMQARNDLREIPIIIVSGLEPEEIREGARHYANIISRAALIVGKPVDGDYLLDLISRVTTP